MDKPIELGTPETPVVDIESELNELADQLLSWSREQEDAKERLKTANTEIEVVERKMTEIMQALNRTKFDYNGILLYMYVSSFPKMKDPDKFLEWCKENGEEGIWKYSVNPQTLRAWYKGKAEQYAEVLTGDGMLEIFEKIKIGKRKA